MSRPFMKAYIFFSVHEELFHRVAERLQSYGVTELSGFVWGRYQQSEVSGRGVSYDPMVVFTRDLLPECDDGRPADLEWLARRETELGVPLQRMLASERHLLKGRNFDQIMRMAEVGLRRIAEALDRAKPDFIFSEDVSCFHSYAHFLLARERNIPFWCITSGRLPYTISVYSKSFQRSESVEAMYREICARGLRDDERRDAEAYVAKFRDRPTRPNGMDLRDQRPRIELKDAAGLLQGMLFYAGDRDNPTATSPLRAMKQRLQRIARVRLASMAGIFETPVEGEKYVLYPLHYQPEASTLVQAPMYLDQIQLIEDMAKSLPAGHRLYVKEHLSSRGRRPLSYYQAIKRIPTVRLLGPDVDTWKLINNAAAIAVITGTMGWEGLIFDKPVFVFGEVFYDVIPSVVKVRRLPKDDWAAAFKQAITSYRPDRESLLSFVAALQRRTSPGFMKNPRVFPEVLSDENLDNITRALAVAAGLTSTTAHASPSSEAI